MEPQECVTSKVKSCTKCGEVKPLDSFSKNNAQCKTCVNAYYRAYYKANSEKVIARTSAYKASNEEKVKAMMADWYVRNKERVSLRMAEYRSSEEVMAKEKLRTDAYYESRKIEIQAKRKKALDDDVDRQARLNAYQKQFYQDNKHYYYEKCSRRNRAMKVACPKWADITAIREVYKRSIEISQSTGIKHVVDHIVPLKNEIVCGLHVEFNLRIITEKENLSKNNKFTG